MLMSHVYLFFMFALFAFIFEYGLLRNLSTIEIKGEFDFFLHCTIGLVYIERPL